MNVDTCRFRCGEACLPATDLYRVPYKFCITSKVYKVCIITLGVWCIPLLLLPYGCRGQTLNMLLGISFCHISTATDCSEVDFDEGSAYHTVPSAVSRGYDNTFTFSQCLIANLGI